MKKYDIVAVTGEYTTSNGETKKRYKNVGAVMEGKNGPYILMDRTFSPAGLDADPGRDSVFLSLFEPRNKQQSPHQESKQNGYQDQPAFDDDIPF